jgi:putative transposase
MPDQTDPQRKKVRHYDTGEPHFLTFSCYRGMKLLSKDRTRQWFVEALQEARLKHGFHLWAWVIMPEHVHVLLWPPADQISPDPNDTTGRLRGILSSIKRPVATKAVAYLRKHSPTFLERMKVVNARRVYYRFWQTGSGFDANVTEPAALHEMVEYIHANPIRRGLVKRADEWMWSSAGDLAGRTNLAISVDRTIPSVLEIPWMNRRSVFRL